MTTWFTSDHHFGHQNIIDFCGRPFDDVDHMNIEMVRRWTERVQPTDHVWVVGDVAMGKLDDTLEIVDSLPGYKHLIVGNHDRCFGGRGTPEKIARWTDRYLEIFESVQSWCITEVAGREVLLCHFPYANGGHVDPKDRYSGLRPDDEGGWLIHGHTHSPERVLGRQVHVGVDAWDFYPVSDQEVAAIMDEVEGAGS